jgi:hypothetical protein
MGDHMFRDLALSRDTMVEYHDHLGPGSAAEQRLTAMVLQQSFWPFSSRTAQSAIIPVPVRCHSFLFFFFSNPFSVDAKGARWVRCVLQ